MTRGTAFVQTLGYGDLLREHARSRPDVVAVVDGSTRLTWPQLDERVNGLATALDKEGVGDGGPVAWLGQNSFRLLETMLAAAKLGALFCPVNWRSSGPELAFILDDLAPAVVVWQDEEVGETVRAGRAETRAVATWIRHDGPGDADYEGRLHDVEPADPDRDVDPASGLLAIYTAAFEGRPAAAVLSHTALVVQNLVMGRLQDIHDGSVYLNAGPLFHIGTFMATNATFHHGGTNVFTRRSDAEEICRLVETERCTHGFVPGPTMDAVIAIAAGHDLTSLWAEPADMNRMNPIVTPRSAPWHGRGGSYGQSEVGGLASFKAIGRPSLGSSGRPSGGCVVRVVADDGSDLPAGEIGEIVVRGPLVMNGYHDREAENASRRRDGWHHTRDLGRREEDGSISFIGPAVSMIKSAAENIYPVEVEACLKAHPAVADVCVIGVPDPVWAQTVKAVVVLRDGMVVDADELIDHCRARIASYKKPRIVEFTEVLPRSGAFVDRTAVDRAFGGGGYPTGAKS